ncbi:MAG: hypothetical protein KTR28_08060 [Micavibrio sp.]|nr:hypothetical protein [Micavibrio sp.]
MKQIRHFALIAAFLSLTACETMEGLKADVLALDLPSFDMSEISASSLSFETACPKIDIVKDLRALAEFSNSNYPNENNLISRVTLSDLKSSCRSDPKTVTVDLKMKFDGALGKEGRTGSGETPIYSYPFFVAVSDRSGDVLAKEIFSANITYHPGENHHQHFENMRQIIPLDRYNKAQHYKILIGFQLGPDQLAYNRSDVGKTAINNQIVANGGVLDLNAPPPMPLAPGIDPITTVDLDDPTTITAPAK